MTKGLMKSSTTKVKGSFGVGEITYDHKTEVLTVVLLNHGVDRETVRYSGVPSDVVERFRNAESKGGFFNRFIRNNYLHLG